MSKENRNKDRSSDIRSKLDVRVDPSVELLTEIRNILAQQFDAMQELQRKLVGTIGI